MTEVRYRVYYVSETGQPADKATVIYDHSYTDQQAADARVDLLTGKSKDPTRRPVRIAFWTTKPVHGAFT
jgi:hypothetical protein